MLAFPVDGVDGSAIWSGFGAERDGGRRAHRGVDIFAPRGTPVLAATDGWVTRVETTRVGGNVVWMQPLFGNMRVYYAHLHEQWVEPGDFVLAGQPLGAVGNTGNAITTPPHLHFGVYVRRPGVRGGAQRPRRIFALTRTSRVVAGSRRALARLGPMSLRDQVDRLLPGWRQWYPSLFDAAADLGLIRARVCPPGSLLLSRRHADVQREAEEMHRERWGGGPPEDRSRAPERLSVRRAVPPVIATQLRPSRNVRDCARRCPVNRTRRRRVQRRARR